MITSAGINQYLTMDDFEKDKKVIYDDKDIL